MQENIQQKDNNFFLKDDSFVSSSTKSEPIRRLNDYDFNILREDAYKDVSDEVLKLEYKISKYEKSIEDLDKQIQSAKDIRDFILAEDLFTQKKQLQEDLRILLNEYNSSSLSAKISNGFTTSFTTKFDSAK